eukprot:XP_014787581.1 PREDICTED: rabankyrin-5-like [Octopus bimaculoides]
MVVCYCEVTKLQNHLSLLREEYVKLQERLVDVEKKYHVAIATTGQSAGGDDSFVSRLLKTVGELFNKETYSDITILLQGGEIKAHKFIMTARSSDWGPGIEISKVSQLDLTDISYDVAYALLKWVYTDEINIKSEETFLLELLKVSARFQLDSLGTRCENALMSFVTMKNCIKFYQSAEEMAASILKKHCSELISSHWDDFTSEDFANMPAALLYRMFKSKSEYVLHTAIRVKREDVVFLYLIEFDSQLSVKLNELDTRGDIPLDLALLSRQESIAQLLVSHRADVNRKDNTGRSLLHKAIKRGDSFSAIFLIRNKADINAITHLDQECPLHMVASYRPEDSDSQLIDGMAQVCQELLLNGANPNAQSTDGSTPLHRAVYNRNRAVFDVLLKHGCLNLELKNADSQTALWLALQLRGDSLLIQTTGSGNGSAGIFLANNGALVNHVNFKALYTEVDEDGNDKAAPVGKQTPLHLAIIHKYEEIVSLFLEHKGKTTPEGDAPLQLAIKRHLPVIVEALCASGVNMNIVDKDNNCPLWLALDSGQEDIAHILVKHGCDVDMWGEGPDGCQQNLLHQAIDENNEAVSCFLIRSACDKNSPRRPGPNEEGGEEARYIIIITDNKGRNFLHTAIMNGDIESVLFLISVHADVNSRVQDAQQYTPLHLAVLALSEIITRNLILAGADVNERTLHGESALHLSSMNDNASLVTALLENGVEINAVDENQNNALHIAVAHGNMHTIRCLLTESTIEAEVPNGKGQNPLHILCQYGKDNAAAIFELFREAMPDYPIDAPDMEGNSALLLAYLNGNGPLCRALVRANACLGLTNKHGCSIFNATVASKQLIFKLLDMLSKEPPWCDGENCLECGVKFGIKTRKHHW